ncbi:hypothetical protein J4G33_04685 [Actinotalea sp. BY-33]|uniref:Uncharacterized protein n=1 Tax=Actinotalea soli TaxID=2819234 RepID=A0A939LR42_9CELL|nr:hypothetical protein [Actinotalea soli]MBO1751095.1 hypothetical protein [Actinotalea soli]
MEHVGIPPGGAPVSGPSDDAEAISQAADAFSADNPSSTVALVEASTAQTALRLVETAAGTATSVSAPSTLTVAPDGTITMAGAGGDTMRIDITADASDVEIVDGVVVASGVAAATELVTRATDAGVQVVAVLADESAPTDISFPLDLPDGAELVEQPDGSISILGPVQYDVALPGEEERVTDAAVEIIGEGVESLEDLDNLTDEQIEQLAAIPDEVTEPITVTETIAEIAVPWAVDADGVPLPTYYSVEGSTVVQTVETTTDTAFPVVADPSWQWWVEKGAKCVGGVIALGAAGYAKVAVGIAKLVVKMKQAKSTTALGKAYTAWKKLGSSNSAIFKEIVKQIKALGNMVVKHGSSGVAKHKASSTKAAASITLLKEGARVVAGVFGLGACYEMVIA